MKHSVTIVLALTALVLTTAGAFAGWTAIKGVKNATAGTIRITTTESGAGGDIPSGRTAAMDIWIPWAVDRSDFERHHITVEVPWGTRKYAIWQSNKEDGDWVRYNTPPYYPDPRQGPGMHVPGCARVDGNRILEVYADRIQMECIASFKARRLKKRATQH